MHSEVDQIRGLAITQWETDRLQSWWAEEKHNQIYPLDRVALVAV